MINAKFEPVYHIRVQLIITHPDIVNLDPAKRMVFLSNDFKNALGYVNQYYRPVGIYLDFNPSKDAEYQPDAEKYNKEPWSELQEIAQYYHGKIVMFYRGNGLNAGSHADLLHLIELDLIHESGVIAHELGHYFYLGHTFVKDLTLAQLPEIIKNGVEADLYGKKALQMITELLMYGAPPETTMRFDDWESFDMVHFIGTRILNEATDGDTMENLKPKTGDKLVGGGAWITDTPGCLEGWDPKEVPPGIKYCEMNFPITVTFSNGYTHTYEFTPDVWNIMSYGFRECRPPIFSNDQIKVVRNAIIRGGRKHLTEAPIKWGGWSAMSGNGTTDVAMASASLGKRTYVVRKGIGISHLFITSKAEGQSFGNWELIPGSATDAAPAVASLGKRVYVVRKGIGNNGLGVTSTKDGKSFDPNWMPAIPGNVTTDAAPAVASLGDHLYVFVKGIGDPRIYVISKAEGNPWGNWAEMPREMRTFYAPTAASQGVVDGRLFVFAVGKDKHIYYISAQYGKPFGKWLEIPIGFETNASVAAAKYNDQWMFVYAKGLDHHVYINSAKFI